MKVAMFLLMQLFFEEKDLNGFHLKLLHFGRMDWYFLVSLQYFSKFEV